jgi:aminoglycoside phosphotransferase (APT) family kinase protein
LGWRSAPDLMQLSVMSERSGNQWIKANSAALAASLAEAGIAVDADSIRVLDRDDRFVAVLPGDRMAWFPRNETGMARLARETRVLRLLRAQCDFRVPVVEYESAAGWQVRRIVPGHCDPVATYRRAVNEPQFAAKLGKAIGTMLASQHAIAAEHLTGWLPTTPSWPPPRAQVERDLKRVVDDRSLIARALALIERHEDGVEREAEWVLTHCDLGFHNMVVDEVGNVIGIFDYDDAAFANRHIDFRYLLLEKSDEVLLEAAVSAYCAAGGANIDPARVRVLNAASAVGFLAFRAGHGPDDRPAGRTLVEDLRWTRLALARADG